MRKQREMCLEILESPSAGSQRYRLFAPEINCWRQKFSDFQMPYMYSMYVGAVVAAPETDFAAETPF